MSIVPTPLDRARVDAQAQQAVIEWLTGDRTEDQARAALAELVYRSTVPEDTARLFLRKTTAEDQVAIDLASAMRSLAVDKILLVAANGYDLARGNGASFSGWMNRLMWSAAPSLLRPTYRSAAREVSADRQVEGADGSTFEAFGWQEASIGAVAGGPDSDLDLDVAEAAAARYATLAQRARDLTKVHLQARAVTTMYGLPNPARVLDPQVREQVREEVSSDPRAAATVASRLAAGKDVHSPVASVFDGWSADDLANLAAVDARVATAIALAGVTARPGVKRRHGSALVAKFAQHTTDGAGARRCAQAWMRQYATITGSEAFGYAEKPSSQVAAEYAAFAFHAVHLLREAGVRGAVTLEELDSLLHTLAEEVAVEAACVPEQVGA